MRFVGLLFVSVSLACLLTAGSFAQESVPDSTKELTNKELTETEAELVQAVEESREVYAQEMFPIQNEANKASSKIWAQINQQRELIRRLETEQTTLVRIRREIEQLNEKLEVLREVEEVLTDMNPDAKNEAITDAKERQKDLESDRKAISGPLMDDLSTLNRLYSNNNGPFAEQFKIVFREEATEAFEGFVRTHLNSNYAAAQVSSRYDREKEKVTMSLIMTGTKQYESMLNQKRIREFGKFNDKYPIINQSERNLMFLVNDIQISVHLTAGEMERDELRMFVNNVINFETLEKTLGKLKSLRLDTD